MYFSACLINTLILPDFYRFTSGRFDEREKINNKNKIKIVDYSKKKYIKILLVSKCSWSFPNRSILIFISFSSSLLMVLFLILL